MICFIYLFERVFIFDHHELTSIAGICGCAASDSRTNKWCPNTLLTYLRCLRSLRLLETSRCVKSSSSYSSHGRVT